MTSRREDQLRGLSLEALLRRSVTSSPPAETAKRTASTSPRDLAQVHSHLRPSPAPPSPSPGCPANSCVWRSATSPAGPPPPLHISDTPSPKYPSSLDTQNIIFGQGQPHAESRVGVRHTPFFNFTLQVDMVREQEPARNPLAPSMGNSLPPPNPQRKDKDTNAVAAPRPPQLYPDLHHAIPSEPEFGKPTSLGASPQPFARTQPLVRPGTNVSAPRQAGGNQKDKYSNLFVPPKNPSQRAELHKPHVSTNPLQAFRAIKSSNSQPAKPSSSRALPQDDDVVEIPNPTSFPRWQPKPFVHPTFSSQTSTNPYFKPQNVVDLTLDRSGMAAKNDFFKEESYSNADPYIYMDSAQANENIKALLEGAFEEEEDKPRTRSRKKPSETKVDDLADKIKNMTVKGEDKTDADDEEEEEEEEEEDGTVVGLKVKLLPHQIEGVSWMRDKETGTKKTRGVLPKGGILADDMGLGKTIQSIALILTNPKPSTQELEATKRKLPEGICKGTLVVAPLALIKQWEGEIKDRIDEDHALKVCVHHGPQRAKSYKELLKYDIVITTYQTLSSEHAGSEGSLKVGCFGVHWYRIMLDEAHSIKNRNAKATKAACALNAEYRWCLTGTPMQNNLDELQSLIHFLRIKPYDDLNQWREQITKPWNNGKAGLALRRLQVYLKAFMKRRTKDVLKQQGPSKDGKGRVEGKSPGFKIVARTVEKVEAEFTDAEREFYKRLESRTDRSLEMMMAGNKMSYASALVLLMRLRQACNHPKLTGSDLSTENDALSGSQTPSRRKASVEDDMDNIANMLGGLSVETKRCDVCQVELSRKEASEGVIRCVECEADLRNSNAQFQEKKKAKKERRIQQERRAVTAQRRVARRIVEDSDEEENGEEDADDASSSLAEDGTDDDEYSSDESDSQEASIFQSTKIRRLMSILKSDSHQHKYIVFSFFTSMLDLIEPFLKDNRVRFVRYDGKMRNDAREASLHSLRSDPSVRVLLCSLRAGSLGLNLTAASRVVILEPFWNPFVEEQAIDRVHRLNQIHDVKVYKLTVKDTVEERILELQEKKRELANATIEGKKGAMKLTLQDMLKLFGREAESEHPVEVNSVEMGSSRGRGLLERTTTSSNNTVATGRPAGAYGSGSGSGSNGSGGRERMRISDGAKNPRKEHEIYGRRW